MLPFTELISTDLSNHVRDMHTTAISEYYEFASDNTAGLCPEALQALLNANDGKTPSYGEAPWTQMAADLIRSVFETDCEAYE